jgi:essential nuclear protein 1
MARTHSTIRSNKHSQSLADEIASTGLLSAKSKKRKAKQDDDEERYVDSKLSRKILKIGQDLADEELQATEIARPNPAFTFDSRTTQEDLSDGDVPEGDDDAWGDEDDPLVEEVVRIFHANALLSVRELGRS